MISYLRRISIEGFRSLENKTVLEFPRNGLILLTGESGIGKTNFFHAINYLLDIATVPIKDMVSWSSEKMSVEAEFIIDDNVYILSRNPKSSEIYKNGVAICSSSKDYVKKLDDIFGTTAEFRSILTYRDQLNPTRFTRLSDSDKKRLLSQLLELEVVENEADIASKTALQLEKNEIASVAELNGMKSVLGQKPLLNNPELLKELKDRLAILNQEYEIYLNNKTTTILNIENKLQYDIDNIQLDIDRTLAETNPVLNFKIQEDYENALKQFEIAKKAYIDEKIAAATKEKELENKVHLYELEFNRYTKVKNEKAALESHSCPTCNQSWLYSKSSDKYIEIKNIIDNYEQHTKPLYDLCVKELNDHRDFVHKLKNSTPSYVLEAEEPYLKAKTALEKEKQANSLYELRKTNAINLFKNKIKDLQAEARDVALRYPKFEKDNELSLLKQSIKEEEYRLNNYKQNLVRWESEQSKFLVKSKQVELSKEALLKERDYLAFLKGFLANIFEELLQESSDRANKVLAELPNTQECRVDFSMTKNSGKESITPIYTSKGHKGQLSSVVSGGQGTGIELAIDLALANTVSVRKGIKLGWLLLDEPFEGFSSSVRESFLQVLQDYAKTCLVFVVDHASEFQEHFTDKLIIKDGKIEWHERSL